MILERIANLEKALASIQFTIDNELFDRDKVYSEKITRKDQAKELRAKGFLTDIMRQSGKEMKPPQTLQRLDPQFYITDTGNSQPLLPATGKSPQGAIIIQNANERKANLHQHTSKQNQVINAPSVRPAYVQAAYPALEQILVQRQ